MYETHISDARWIAYDLPGNVGWIAYLTGVILTFAKQPELLRSGWMLAILLAAVLPAIMMLVGIVELISERIHKLDRVLSKKRLYRGFGMLYFGGLAGTLLSAAGVICALTVTDERLTYLWVMLCGAILCAIFAGLLFKGYRPK